MRLLPIQNDNYNFKDTKKINSDLCLPHPQHFVICGWIILCCGSWPGHYWMFSTSLPSMYYMPVAAPSQVVTTKNICRYYQLFQRELKKNYP